MRRLLALLSAAALVAAITPSTAVATKGTPGQSDQTDHLACSVALVATLATCSQVADGISIVTLTGDPTGDATGKDLWIMATGATIVAASGDFALAGGVVTDPDPIDLSLGDHIVLRAPTAPGSAVVRVYEVATATGIATLEGTLTISFVGQEIDKSARKVTGDAAFGPISITIAAHASDPAKGEFQATWGASGSMQGDVTCVVIDGQDAWIAGLLTSVTIPAPAGITWQGFFLWVHDAGQPSETATDTFQNVVVGSSATLPPAVFQGWCQGKVPPLFGGFAVTSGNLKIH